MAKQVVVLVVVAAAVAGAVGGGVAYLLSRHDSGSGAASSERKSTSSRPTAPATTFTADEKHTWVSGIEPVSTALFKATTSGIKKCNSEASPTSPEYVRCITDRFASLAATIEQGEITVKSMTGELHGQCRSAVDAYLGVLDTMHGRVEDLLDATANQDYTRGGALIRQLSGTTLIDAATPVVNACEPL
jgi:hypothetical protein